jgi:hypothetical protein
MKHCPFCHKALVPRVKEVKYLSNRVMCKNSDCYILGFSRFQMDFNKTGHAIYYSIILKIDEEVYEVLSKQDISVTSIFNGLCDFNLIFTTNQFTPFPKNNIVEYYTNLVRRAFQLRAFQ